MDEGVAKALLGIFFIGGMIFGCTLDGPNWIVGAIGLIACSIGFIIVGWQLGAIGTFDDEEL